MPEDTTLVGLLRSCAKQKDLHRGTRLHATALKRGLLEKSSPVADAVVRMYARCYALAKAENLLDGLSVQDVFAWTALIAGYTQKGQGQDALNCFEWMHREGVSPDAVTFSYILKACGSIGAADKGEQIHNEITDLGLLENNVVLGTALVDMYAKCGALVKAQWVLDQLPSRDVVAWSALIAGYAHRGQGEEALNCFEKMQEEGIRPDSVTFTSILKACGSIGATSMGEQIHDEIVRQGLLKNNIVLGTALVDMYAKCGALAKAVSVLNELGVGDVVSWSALIAGYAQQGQGEEALKCFERMQHKGLSPNATTFTSILKACGSIGAIEKGEQIHDEIVRQGLLGKDMVLGNALVDMYAKCGALVKAQQVLEELSSLDVISWNALIGGYAQKGQGEDALNCFEQMQRKGHSPNSVTFACVLKACGSIGAADKGEQIHGEIAKQGLLQNNMVLGNGLVDMYAKCGALAKAQQVFDDLPVRDVVSWSALIAGYAQQGRDKAALSFFERMQHEGLVPSAVTFICILKACGSIGAIDKGEQIHDDIVRLGLLGSDVMLGTALVDMYAKCGALVKARCVLDGLIVRDVVSWSALITGYAEQGQGEEALNCYEQMESEGLSPDMVTFICILKACGSIGAADQAERIHNEIERLGLLKNNLAVGTALVDMYAKCGALAKAQEVLEELPVGDVVSWSALIGGYAQQGHVEEALSCLELMQCKGLSPDAVTFSCLLNACNHASLVEQGELLFANMITKFGMKPDREHYSIMIDLFGRAGHLDKAVALIQRISSSDNPAVWSALLGACHKWGDVNVGRWAFQHLVQSN